MHPNARPLEIRFWKKVRMTATCWLWTAKKTLHGYGQIRVGHKLVSAHRVAWELAQGVPVSPDMCVLHTCDTRLCVRPDHLYLGTHKDNVKDRQDRGRTAAGIRNSGHLRRGEKHANAKFTDEQVRQIRESKVGSRSLAAQLGVARNTIRHIRQRKAWKHVE